MDEAESLNSDKTERVHNGSKSTPLIIQVSYLTPLSFCAHINLLLLLFHLCKIAKIRQSLPYSAHQTTWIIAILTLLGQTSLFYANGR